MTAYVEESYYQGPSTWKLYENESYLPASGLAFARLEKLLLVVAVIGVTAVSLERKQRVPKLFAGKLAALYQQRIRVLHGYGSIPRLLELCRSFYVYITAGFPLQPNVVNDWFDHVPSDDPDDNRRVIRAINLDNDGWTNKRYSRQHGVGQFPNGLADNQHRLFFHGTNHEFAVDIIENGIDLKKGTKRGDFSNGNGFYVTDDFEAAFEWAGSKYKRSSRAVLVFRVGSDRFDGYNSKNLCWRNQEEEWRRIVKTCRSGVGLTEKDYDCIEGPMANVSRKHVTVKPRSYQLCILSDDMAECFDECIHSVVFRR